MNFEPRTDCIAARSVPVQTPYAGDAQACAASGFIAEVFCTIEKLGPTYRLRRWSCEIHIWWQGSDNIFFFGNLKPNNCRKIAKKSDHSIIMVLKILKNFVEKKVCCSLFRIQLFLQSLRSLGKTASVHHETRVETHASWVAITTAYNFMSAGSAAKLLSDQINTLKLCHLLLEKMDRFGIWQESKTESGVSTRRNNSVAISSHLISNELIN